jgi:hypothetical protein
LQFKIVDDPDLRNDEAEFGGDLATYGLDLIGEFSTRRFIDEAEKPEAKFDLDIVDRQRLLDRRLGYRLGALRRDRLGRSLFFFSALLLEAAIGAIACQAGKPENGIIGMPGSTPARAAMTAAIARPCGFVNSWMPIALSAAPSTPAFDTSMPAATETIRAGICETMPSPTVSRV